jgi:WbqC-like protein family
MIVSIMQPAYLPWLGYFHRIGTSDLYIVLDHVQIDKNSKTKFTNRNKVRTREGWCWLTVPLKTKGRFGKLYINQLEIANETPWADKHWSTIQSNYAKATYFAQHASFLEQVYSQQWEYLTDLTRVITRYLLDAFGIKTPILFSSEMKVEGQKDELILNLCHAVDAEVYISGPFGRDYLHEHLFCEAGIRIVYHDYHHPTYPQVYPNFEAYMSALDLLLNCGPSSVEILEKDQELIS